jgi:glycosyltransferase involved in cell wall biosynthesis
MLSPDPTAGWGWRIDFLASEPAAVTSSGLSRFVWELAAELKARGHEPRVLYPSEGGATPAPYRGVPHVPVPVQRTHRRPFGRDIEAGQRASELLDPRADVVVGNDEKAGTLALPRRAGRPARRVQVVHDVALHTFDTLRPPDLDRGLRQRIGNLLDRWTLRRLERRALVRADLVIAASELNRELLSRYYGLNGPGVALLPHGVPEPVEVGTREAARAALHLPPRAPVVLFVGRTPGRQGLPTALAAFRRARARQADLTFVVVGSRLPPEEGVVSLGVVDEATKGRAFRAADVFLFPSRYEGYGLAPREAMRYGLATVVSSHVPMDGAGPTVVRIVASDEPEAWAEELGRLLEDPSSRAALAAAGRAWADGFSYAKTAEAFELLLASRRLE